MHVVNERNQTKIKTNKASSYSKWPRILLFDLAHKQSSGIIKWWLHCLTSESKRRFLANNMLLASCLAMVQIQFSLIKKIKIGRPEHLLTPHPLRPITFHFYFTPAHAPSSKCTSYVYRPYSYMYYHYRDEWWNFTFFGKKYLSWVLRLP